MNPTRMFIGIAAVAMAILSMYMFQQQHNLGKTPEMALRTCVEAIKDGDMRTFSQYTIDGDTFWKEWKKASREEKDMVQAMLPWRLSNTLDSAFCVEALNEALSLYGRPEIFNTDQGSQFTSEEFTGVLSDSGVRISMDGKGRWMDNVFIERLWRSLKYECVYLREFETAEDAKREIGNWMEYYNTDRPHSSLADKTPMELYSNMVAA